MIRNATEADIPHLVEMGRKFFRRMNRPEVGEYSAEAASQSCRALIEGGILLVSERGMIGGLVYPFYMTGKMTAQELFWWAEDGNGMALLRAFEERAKEMGAEINQMIALDSVEPEKVDRLYRRAGYRPTERSYMRTL